MVKKNFATERNKRNLGLEIFRMLLCFWVVLFHSINSSNNFILNFILHKTFHVPSFFFISFYYFFPIVRERNSFKMKLRLVRLFFPYFIWPLIIWSSNNLLYLIIAKNRFGRLLSFKELKIQLITGRLFLIQFWFLFNLIFLSLFFFIISSLRKNILIIFLNLFLLICYVTQYFRSYYFLYTRFKDCIAHSVGHLIVSFPIAVTAFNLNKINLIKYLEIQRYKSLLSLLLIVLIIFIYGEPSTYNGIDKNLFSLFSFYLFYLIPLNKYLGDNCKNFIYIITNYTQGIYCLHIIVKFYLFRLFKQTPTFISCIYIYLISYILSFFGFKICKGNKIKYLFI